jgi:hypothetical protein
MFGWDIIDYLNVASGESKSFEFHISATENTTYEGLVNVLAVLGYPTSEIDQHGKECPNYEFYPLQGMFGIDSILPV